jgi:hypothetical protein
MRTGMLYYSYSKGNEVNEMKMFLLGMLVMWIILSVGFFLLDSFKLDLFEHDRCLLNVLFIPLLLVSVSIEAIIGLIGVIKVLDLVIKYRINPFHTSISQIRERFSKEDKEIFVKRMAKNNKNLERKWRMALDI